MSESTITVRRIAFGESLQNVPRHYAVDGDLIQSHLWAVLSASFPDGEDFFVRSVRHFRQHVTDPTLKRHVNAFIGQEAMHGREHRALNARLAAVGYPVRRLAWIVRRYLTLRERVLPAKANLAMTAALEHYTASLAELLMRDPQARALLGTSEFNELIMWHALEESEHKAVAFDVYRAVGGSERMRTLIMRTTTALLLIFVGISVALGLLGDREAYRRGALRQSWRRFRRSPLMSREFRQTIRDYNRAGFHPDDHGNDELVARAREELFGPSGSLTDKLTVSVA